MKHWSKTWKNSKLPKKQHKYRANAPLHVKSKFLASTLSKELREKHKRRNIRVIVGDKIKILRGDNKGKTGKVEKVDVKTTKIYVTGIDVTKRDGSKANKALNPSNIMITELSIKDKKREARLKK